MAIRKKAPKQASRARSSAKRKVAKRRTAAKKSVAKKSPRRKALAPGIGVVSSIRFGETELETQFLAGAQTAAVEYSDGDYDRHRMATAIQGYNDESSIGLIVAVGGLGTAMELLANATKPWIALIGGAPGTFPSGQLTFFRGAVSLESYVYNPIRINHLRTKNIQLQDICLLYNPNSACSAIETHDWPSQGGPKIVAGINPATGRNDPDYLYNPATQAGAFDTIPNNVRAVIVSGDPFFQDKKDRLVTAANKWVGQAGTNRFVCYPCPEYKDATPPPIPRKRICHGPKLKEAYKKLGQRAASVISSGGTGFNLDKMPPGTPDEN